MSCIDISNNTNMYTNKTVKFYDGQGNAKQTTFMIQSVKPLTLVGG